MNRKNTNRKATNLKTTNPKSKNTTYHDEHFAAIGQLLTQLRTHLTASSAKIGTYGDYLRVLEFYCEDSAEQAREIIVSWVANEKLETEPLP